MTRALQPTGFRIQGGGPLSVTYTGGVEGQDSFCLILDNLRFIQWRRSNNLLENDNKAQLYKTNSPGVGFDTLWLNFK